MATHLSPGVLLEMAEAEAVRGDGRPPAAVHSHLAECAGCRQVFEDARVGLARLRQVDVPEPSPLFWDHFSSRVHQAIDRERRGAPPSGWRVPRLAWRSMAVASAVVLVAAGIAWRVETGRGTGPLSTVAAPGHPVSPAPPVGAASATIDEEPLQQSSEASWRLVTAVASNVDLDTATQAGGFALQPGAAERAALQLTSEEQRELVRLLQAAVERPQ